MEAQPKRCRRCLLQDMADENDYYASVVRYRATMPRRAVSYTHLTLPTKLEV